MNKHLSCLLAGLMLAGAAAYAQTDLKEAYKSFASTAENDYNEFSRNANKAFARTLKENWTVFKVMEAQTRPKKVVPDTIHFRPDTLSAHKDSLMIDISNMPMEQKQIAAPIETNAYATVSVPSSVSLRTVEFNYFGVPCTTYVPRQYGNFHPKSIAESSVSTFWENLSYGETAAFFDNCRSNFKQLKLNDWAKLEWIRLLSKKLFPSNRCSEQTMFTVFCLNQLGLRAKMARTGKSLITLFASAQEVYGRKYVLIGEDKYYIADQNVNVTSLESYASELTLPQHGLDLSMTVHPTIGGPADTVLCLNSTVLGDKIRIPAKKGTKDFYKSYPQLDVNYYASAATDSDFTDQLKTSIKNLLAGKKGEDAVNTLLHFVQNDFNYKTDSEQFDREKPFFCEENFFYPFNDCEDRVVLFTYLVRKVLGYDCLLLEYPNHLSCAVCIGREASGYHVRKGLSNYYICDPTCIGASLGDAPEICRTKPQRVWVL